MANPDHTDARRHGMAWHGNVSEPAVLECERVNQWLNGFRFESQGDVGRTLTAPRYATTNQRAGKSEVSGELIIMNLGARSVAGLF
jgi:hypothetical protein